MKNIFMKLIVSGILIFSVFLVSYNAEAEQINSFDVELNISQSGTIAITESISYDFGNEQRHGIFRHIPITYEREGAEYRLRVSNVSVKDSKGETIPVSISSSNGSIEFKVGDPDKFVTGVQQYHISYAVQRGINFFPDYDELYWNVTGSGWQVPIHNSSAKVSLTTSGSIQATCFVGAVGSREQCAQSMVGSTVLYSARSLMPGEGLTIVYGFPKGVVAPPTRTDAITYFLQDNGILALPIIVFVLMVYVWWKRGRDPKGKGTIVPQYEPPNGLSPLEVGVLVDEHVQARDISAEIIYLAVMGYIKISKVEGKKLLVFPVTDYRIDKLKDDTSLQHTFDKKLYEVFFGGNRDTVLLSEIKKNTAAFLDLQDAKKQVYASLSRDGYFLKNPQHTRALWIFVAVCVGVAVWIIGVFATIATVLPIVAAACSGAVVLVFAFFMPARTRKGVEAREYSLGLKKYIEVAEKDRLAFANAPEKNPQRFENILPYAMALGVDKAWSQVFKDIEMKPTWYSDPASTTFNALAFNAIVGDFSSSVNSVVATSSAGSGGSGFSGGGGGGGFGGGGGGSW